MTCHLTRASFTSLLSAVSKTFTMTGDRLVYENRGIIPRALGHIFRAIGDRPDLSFRVSISYVEIYNGRRTRSH